MNLPVLGLLLLVYVGAPLIIWLSDLFDEHWPPIKERIKVKLASVWESHCERQEILAYARLGIDPRKDN